MKKPLPPINKIDFQQISDYGFRWLDNIRDFTHRVEKLTATIDPASLSANATSAQAFTVQGVKVGDYVLHAEPTTFTDDFMLVNSKVTDTDEITIQLHRGQATTYDPPSETYTFIVLKGTS